MWSVAPLPGTTANAFNRGMDRADLARIVAQFNSTYAGRKDALGAAIPHLMLPAHYSLGDDFHALDLRLSRSFLFRERWRLSIIGEVFNLYNKANLTGNSGDLTSPAFGQPTSRATQIFGSGGPRFSTCDTIRFLISRKLASGLGSKTLVAGARRKRDEVRRKARLP